MSSDLVADRRHSHELLAEQYRALAQVHDGGERLDLSLERGDLRLVTRRSASAGPLSCVCREATWACSGATSALSEAIVPLACEYSAVMRGYLGLVRCYGRRQVRGFSLRLGETCLVLGESRLGRRDVRFEGGQRRLVLLQTRTTGSGWTRSAPVSSPIVCLWSTTVSLSLAGRQNRQLLPRPP